MKKVLDRVNQERREFVKQMTKTAFVVPAVVSVTMATQTLPLDTVNVASGNQGVMN